MKQKTHSGAKKRFRKTGSKKNGQAKIVGRKASARHLLLAKSDRQKALQHKPYELSPADAKTVKKLLNV